MRIWRNVRVKPGHLAKAPRWIQHQLRRIPSHLYRQSLYWQAFRHKGRVRILSDVTSRHRVVFQGCGHLVIERSVEFGFEMAGAINSPILLQPREPNSLIVIGPGSRIMNGCELIARTAIELGSHCLVGPQVVMIDADFHGLAPDAREQSGATPPIVIENNVWIGMRALILKGVHISMDAVVAAGCVLTKDVPTGAIVAGNPMRIIGSVYQQT